MRRISVSVIGALLGVLVVLGVASPSATATPLDASRSAVKSAAAVQDRTSAASRPADVDWGDCLMSVTPVGGLVGSFLGGGSAGCTSSVVETGLTEVAPDVAEAFEAFFTPFVQQLEEFVAELIVTGFTWWLMFETPKIAGMGVLDTDGDGGAELDLNAIALFIGTMIATLLTIFQGLRTMIRRKGTPLLQALQGLLWHMIALGIGVAVIDSLLVASDRLTVTIVEVGFGSAEEAPEQIRAILLPQIGNPVGLLVMAAFVLLFGFVQLVLLFLRQAALPVFALLLPIASSGQVGEGTPRQWMPRLTVAILTVICYKPMAATLITIGFVEMSESNEMLDWFRGLVTLGLSVVALPMMMRLFAPIGMQAGNASTNGGGLATAAMSVVAMARSGGEGSAAGGGGGGATSPTAHAKYMEGQHSAPGSEGPRGADGTSGQREGATAVQHASGADGKVPEQGGQPAQPAVAQPASAGSGAATPAAPAGGGSGGGAAAGGGSVQVAVVAAEAGKGAANKGAGTMSEGAGS
jgi:hypothetical protein